MIEIVSVIVAAGSIWSIISNVRYIRRLNAAKVASDLQMEYWASKGLLK